MMPSCLAREERNFRSHVSTSTSFRDGAERRPEIGLLVQYSKRMCRCGMPRRRRPRDGRMPIISAPYPARPPITPGARLASVGSANPRRAPALDQRDPRSAQRRDVTYWLPPMCGEASGKARIKGWTPSASSASIGGGPGAPGVVVQQHPPLPVNRSGTTRPDRDRFPSRSGGR